MSCGVVSPESTLAVATTTTTTTVAPRRYKEQRTRNGCLVCRSRRIKCDLDKPECRRCINLGAECLYPAKKIFNPESVRRSLQGRHKKAARNSEPGRFEGSPLLEDVVEQGGRQETFSSSDTTSITSILLAMCRTTRMGGFFGARVDPPDFLKVVFPIEQDLTCVHHCITYTLSILVVDESFNPWVKHVAPLFLFPTGAAPHSVLALKYAFLAIGATHISYLQTRGFTEGSSTLAHSWAQTYREEALKHLRIGKRSPQELENDAFLASCEVLLNSDILAGTIAWREVIHFGQLSVRYRGGFAKLLFGHSKLDRPRSELIRPSVLTRCIVEHHAIMSISACYSTGNAYLMFEDDCWWWDALADTASEPYEINSIERACGWNRQILYLATRQAGLLTESYSLKHIFHESDGQVNEIILRQALLQQKIVDLDIQLNAWFLKHEQLGMDERTLIGSLALYHACRIFSLRELNLVERDSDMVQHSADAILQLCAVVGDKVEYMNWPLLIASSQLIHTSQRQVVRGLFRSFAIQCCHEVEAIEMLAEEMWRRIDAGMEDEVCSWRVVIAEKGCSALIA